jgi:hypothetical protein
VQITPSLATTVALAFACKATILELLDPVVAGGEPVDLGLNEPTDAEYARQLLSAEKRIHSSGTRRRETDDVRRKRSTRGSITRRGEDSWRIQARVGIDPTTGEPLRIRETFRGSKTDAERRLIQILAEHERTDIVPGDETIATFARTWLDHIAHRVKPTSLKGYRELLLIHVVPAIAPVRMTELRPAGVQASIDGVLRRRSPRTAVKVYRVLSEMLGEASRWGVTATNPAAAVRPPRAPRPKLHVPDQQTCNAILQRVHDRQVEGPVVLAIGTGMRLGEILGLQWEHVDLDRKVLRVATTLSYGGGEDVERGVGQGLGLACTAPCAARPAPRGGALVEDRW